MTLKPGDLVAGKYRIDSLLGEGGMGSVFVATNERLWKKVALKVLKREVADSPEVAERFTREAVAASSVKHAGIVEIYDADVHDGTPWIAMELLEGENLRERLERAALPAAEAVAIVREVLDALAAVHRAGIVHRDLKPDNVFLERLPSGKQRVKVLDFGIAKILDAQMGSQTQTGMAMGTPFFLAPEQATSSKNVDARADLYSIGSILFHALSGAHAYDAETFGDLVRQMYTVGPRSLALAAPSVPAALAEVVDRCLAVDPAQRPANAEELSRLLEQALAAGGSAGTALVAAQQRTLAMSAEQLKRDLASAPGAGSAPGWHPAPASASPIGGTMPFGSPSSAGGQGAPAGPQYYGAPPAGPSPGAANRTGSSGGGAGLVIAVVVGLVAVVGVGAIVMLAGGLVAWSAVRHPRVEVVTAEPAYDPSVAPALGALGVPGGDVDRVRMLVTETMPQRGPDDALVTIVMFSDYQCPFCNRVEPTLTRLLSEHPNDLRVVWRDNALPFHQNAMPAAEAAREAYAQGGDERFWRMHDTLFENQTSLSREDLDGYASRVGLDLTRYRAAMDAHTHQAGIQADMAAAGHVGARGTPAFFLNGRQLMGAQPYESFDTMVREEIAVAQALVARGVPRARVYEHLMRDAIDGPPPSADAPAPTPTPARATPDPNAVYNIPIGASPSKGPADALVTIVEVSEFQCPFCSRVQPTLTQIRERYGNDVRIVFKHNPLAFHDNAMPAAEAASEVYRQLGNDAFWRYHDVLFENQTDLSRENLERFAAQLGGVNMAQLRNALDNHTHRAAIEADQQLAISRGASGTPSFFINGRNLRGAQPLEAFQAVIDEEMTRARARVAAGTPRAQVYEALTRDGHTSPQTIGAPAAPSPAEPDADRVYDLAVPTGAPARGRVGAPVTLQLFSDFQCPFCARVGPTLAEIERAYPGQVRIVWRNYPLPFHQQAMPAAEAAVEIHAQLGDSGFWRYHDVLFENQRALERADLERYAAGLGGVDMARFRRALDDHTHAAAVRADMDAITRAGARIGTPSSFVNGRLLQGAQPAAAFRTAIDRALQERGGRAAPTNPF